MKKFNKILMIVSIIIFVIGILLGLLTCVEIMNTTTNTGSIYVDGSDISGFVSFFGAIINIAIFIVFLMFSAGIVGIIWLVYGIILLIIKSIKKFQNNRCQ